MQDNQEQDLTSDNEESFNSLREDIEVGEILTESGVFSADREVDPADLIRARLAFYNIVVPEDNNLPLDYEVENPPIEERTLIQLEIAERDHQNLIQEYRQFEPRDRLDVDSDSDEIPPLQEIEEGELDLYPPPLEYEFPQANRNAHRYNGQLLGEFQDRWNEFERIYRENIDDLLIDAREAARQAEFVEHERDQVQIQLNVAEQRDFPPRHFRLIGAIGGAADFLQIVIQRQIDELANFPGSEVSEDSLESNSNSNQD